MIVFGVVLSMEIGFCKFVETCEDDLQEICAEFSRGHVKNANKSKRAIKEAIELHQKIIESVETF